jgi:hypothetical protein
MDHQPNQIYASRAATAIKPKGQKPKQSILSPMSAYLYSIRALKTGMTIFNGVKTVQPSSAKQRRDGQPFLLSI